MRLALSLVDGGIFKEHGSVPVPSKGLPKVCLDFRRCLDDLDTKDAGLAKLREKVLELEKDLEIEKAEVKSWTDNFRSEQKSLSECKEWVAELEAGWVGAEATNAKQRLQIIVLEGQLTEIKNSITYRVETSSD